MTSYKKVVIFICSYIVVLLIFRSWMPIFLYTNLVEAIPRTRVLWCSSILNKRIYIVKENVSYTEELHV